MPDRGLFLCPRRPRPEFLLGGGRGDPRSWHRDPTKPCASSLHLRLPPSSFLTPPSSGAWPSSLHPEPGGPPCLWAPQSVVHAQAAPALIPADSSANYQDSLAPPLSRQTKCTAGGKVVRQQGGSPGCWGWKTQGLGARGGGVL